VGARGVKYSNLEYKQLRFIVKISRILSFLSQITMINDIFVLYKHVNKYIQKLTMKKLNRAKMCLIFVCEHFI